MRSKAIISGEAFFPIVGIGASAGGLEAYVELMRLMPTNTGMAFVLVQHLSPKHLSMLSEIVQKATKMPVVEIEDNTKVLPNHVYVIPPNSVLELFHGVLHLSELKLPYATNRLIDTFFRSLAYDQRNLAVGIVLSGTGSDGAQGLKDIKAEGGFSLVQEPKTAKFDGMPRMAIEIDHPDCIMPVKGLVAELIRIATNPKLIKIATTDENLPTTETSTHLAKIFLTIRATTGTDFSVYKYPTMIRRIKRRMVLHGIDSIKHYHAFLERSPEEAKALFSDLLINVTEFFRDPNVFDFLKSDILPGLIKARAPQGIIRAWVPGCSTGEEVYSLAICLIEALEELNLKVQIQIYGTDISDSIIKKARAGLFTDSITKQVSEERLRRFFATDGNGYRIAKSVRDCCIFSTQDVTIDPPIHRLDILSCRNLMIYLSTEVQKKLMQTFFYALADDGYLLLGAAESIGSASSLFALVDEKNKIYSKRNLPKSKSAAAKASSPMRTIPSGTIEERRVRASIRLTSPVLAAEDVILEEYAPAWILINRSLDIVHIKGNTDLFLSPRSGAPSWNLSRILRAELVPTVRVLMHACEKKGKRSHKRTQTLKINRRKFVVDIEVRRIETSQVETHFLVVLADHERAPAGKRLVGKRSSAKLLKLNEELESSQNSLRSFLDDQTATNEELQSANEEVLASNEELQSTNEELETTKEELQSTNEELVTLNEELSNRNAELSVVNNDLVNVLTNSQLPILIVDNNLAVRRITPMAGKLLSLMPSDIGRKLKDFNLGFDVDKISEKIGDVIQHLVPIEIDLPNRSGRYFSVRFRPYKTTDNRIEGAVITFIDVDDSRKDDMDPLATRRFSEAIIDTVEDPFVVLDRDLKIIRGNKALFELFKGREEDRIGTSFLDLVRNRLDWEQLETLLNSELPQKSLVKGFNINSSPNDKSDAKILLNATRLEWPHNNDVLSLLTFHLMPDIK